MNTLNDIIDNNFYDSLSTWIQQNFEYKIKDNKYVFKFIPIDTEELYKHNLKNQPEDWYYRHNDVTYTLNSKGYRAKEFDDIDWKNSIVIFGCSHIFGTGVTDQHTVPHFLEEISGFPVVNLGIAGSSIQTTLHNGIMLNDSGYPTPKAILPCWTSLTRYQIYLKKGMSHYGNWNASDGPLNNNNHHVVFQNLMNIKMFRNLWKNKTIYLESSFWNEQVDTINKLDKNYFCHSFTGYEPSARDCEHFGFELNYKIAQEIYKQLKPLLEK